MNAIGRFFARYVPSANGYQRFNGIDSVASGTGRKNPFNETAPLAACRTGDLDWAKKEIKKDSSIIFKDYRSGKTGNMVPLLRVGAAEGHFEVAELLINHGADVNLSTIKGSTPLSYAAQQGHLRVAELLINHGADVNRQTEDGSTPLYLAAQNEHGEIVKLFLENGADPKKKRKILSSVEGSVFMTKSPLNAASENGHSEIVNVIKKSINERKGSSEQLTV